jgi:Flp pilus assembly protein TadG
MLKFLKIRKRAEGEKGQSLAEFALLVPVLLMLLVGIVEIGWGLNSYLTVVDGARDGARLGSKGSATDAEITALIVKETERLDGGVPPANVSIIRTAAADGSTSIDVEVCYDHALIMGIPFVIPDPLPMCSSTTMPTVEN